MVNTHTPRHILNVSKLVQDVRFCCMFWCTLTTHQSLWVFCPPVSLRDDVYGPLGSQERAGVGLREADGELLEWSSYTQPPAQCCWCLEPGTAVCVRTAWCGDTHLLQGTEVSSWRTEWLLCLSPSFIFVSLSLSSHLSFFLAR